MMSLASKPYRVLDHLTWIHVAVISKTASASFSERIIIAKGFHKSFKANGERTRRSKEIIFS